MGHIIDRIAGHILFLPFMLVLICTIVCGGILVCISGDETVDKNDPLFVAMSFAMAFIGLLSLIASIIVVRANS